jgi:hypothetical protein
MTTEAQNLLPELTDENIIDFDKQEDLLIIRNFIDKNNEIILNRQEAAILFIELLNFLRKTN